MSKNSPAPASAASEAAPAAFPAPAPAAPPATPAADRGPREPIPVGVIRFRQSVDVPGGQGKMSVTWGEKRGAGTYEIHFLPWLRHHRVTYLERNKAPLSRLFPETWADWVPRSE